MTTTLYKLIFNAVQHHACQTVARDINHCKITHFLCLTEGNVILCFCFSFQLLQALELSHQPGVPCCPLLQPKLLCKSNWPSECQRKADFCFQLCWEITLWIIWEYSVYGRIEIYWNESIDLLVCLLFKFTWRNMTSEDGVRKNPERLSRACLHSFHMYVACSGDRKVGRSRKELVNSFDLAGKDTHCGPMDNWIMIYNSLWLILLL